MINNLNKNLFIIIPFSYVLFFHIEKDQVHLMIILALITCIFSHILIKDDIYEGVDNSVQFTASEEEARRAATAASDTAASTASDTAASTASDTAATTASDTAASTASDTAATTASDTAATTASDTAATTASDTAATTASDTPIPSNTPFVTAEYVRLREEARKKDGPGGPTMITENDSPEGVNSDEHESSSNESMFEEEEEVRMVAVNDKFRMGPYDGLCISSDKFMKNELIKNEELVTYFGFQIPPHHVKTAQDVLKGPTVDGQKDSPQKLSMFANNKTSLNCCSESPYMTSTGCVCLTDNQRNFIQTRGFNKMNGDI